MAGKYQRPQIMPPSASDLKNMESIGRYIERHARRVNDAFAEVYTKMSALEEENRKLRAQAKEAAGNGN